MRAEIGLISFSLGVILIAYILHRILFKKRETDEYKVPEYEESEEEESAEEISETIKKMGKRKEKVIFEKPELREKKEAYEPRVEVKEYVKPSDTVYSVLEKYPSLLEEFVEVGIKGVQNPIVRKAFGKRTTVAEACKQANIDFEEFVYRLNKKLSEEMHGK